MSRYPMTDLENVIRHDGRHVVLFDRDYRWQNTDGRWTLRRETDQERDQRTQGSDPGKGQP